VLAKCFSEHSANLGATWLSVCINHLAIKLLFFADKAGTTLNKLFNEFQENTLGNLVCKLDIRLDLFA
jgi:hypothetical protein